MLISVLFLISLSYTFRGQQCSKTTLGLWNICWTASTKGSNGAVALSSQILVWKCWHITSLFFFFNSMFMKVPIDERHNTISNTSPPWRHVGRHYVHVLRIHLAGSLDDCQCSPGSVLIVVLFFFFYKGPNTLFCKRDLKLFSVFSKRGWSHHLQKEMLTFCITRTTCPTLLFPFPLQKLQEKIKFKPCYILLRCHAAGAVSLPCF